MNALERVLIDDVTRLLDRVAATVPAQCLEGLAARNPTLRGRLEEAEAQMAVLRASLLEGYGRWGRALEDVENLWALAAWRSAAEEPAQQATPSLAAA